MGRKFKLSPTAKRKPDPGKVAKRKATTIKRKVRHGQKPRVVAGTDAARALGIK
jgi:hypothetical protein